MVLEFNSKRTQNSAGQPFNVLAGLYIPEIPWLIWSIKAFYSNYYYCLKVINVYLIYSWRKGDSIRNSYL